MALTSLSKIRRTELVSAAMDVLRSEGVNATTLERVAQRVGTSKSTVLHYFDSKKGLFHATMLYANARLRDEVVTQMRLARTPSDRLWSIVATNLSPAVFEPTTCHNWLALCVEVSSDEQFARLQKVIHARMRSNVKSALVDLVAPADVEPITLGITTLIDGLWLRSAVNKESIDAQGAIDQMLDYITHRIPGFSITAKGE